MTGDQIVSRALVELQSQADRPLETGITLQTHLQESLNLTIDEVFSAWLFEWSFGTAAPITTVAGPALTAAVYNMPSSMVEIIDIILDTGAIDSRKLVRYPLRTFRAKWAAQLYLPMDKPTEWAQINDNQFMVAPTPNTNTYKMSLTGTVRPSPIMNFSLEVTPVPARSHEVLLWGVCMRGALAIRDDGLVAKHTALYGSGITRMITEDKRQPDVEYKLRPFHAAPGMYTTNYWASPFVREV